MKNILCFGDSNTWGYDPDTSMRYPLYTRWTGRLQQAFETHRILECGLCGRTTVFEDPLEPGRCGSKVLPIALKTHDPIDLVIFMLGTNDCKRKLHLNAQEIARGMEKLLQITLSPMIWDGQSHPNVLVIAPPPMDWNHMQATVLEDLFDHESAIHSAQLAIYYAMLCNRYQVPFWNASEVVPKVTGSDGVHMSAQDHGRLAVGLWEYLQRLF